MKTSLKNHQLLLNNHHNKGKYLQTSSHIIKGGEKKIWYIFMNDSFDFFMMLDAIRYLWILEWIIIEWLFELLNVKLQKDGQNLNWVTFTTEKSIKCGNNLVNKKVIWSKTLFRLYPKWAHSSHWCYYSD